VLALGIRGEGPLKAQTRPARNPTIRVWSRLKRYLIGASLYELRFPILFTPKTQLEIAAPCSFRGTKNLEKIQENLKKIQSG
jgi:hypothetical protein